MDITLTVTEIRAVTGYKRPGDQLAELQRRGFYRARIASTTGQVILERPHYDAISAGSSAPLHALPGTRPQLRSVR